MSEPTTIPGKALDPVSPKLKELMDTERAKPKYQSMDSELVDLAALEAIFAEHGDSAFDITNVTDQILRMTITGESF
jgi:hypothetical protein